MSLERPNEIINIKFMVHIDIVTACNLFNKEMHKTLYSSTEEDKHLIQPGGIREAFLKILM